MESKENPKSNPATDKKKSIDRIVNNYLQAKTEGNTTQIKIHEAILKKLGVKVPR